jgi:hypothetical protein
MAAVPTITRGKQVEREARDARLAKALRANLVRRKEQERAREPGAENNAGGTTPRKPPA